MNRRHFLAAASTAMAAAAARLSATSLRAGHPMSFHLSCGAIGVKADQKQAIEYAAKFGYDSVDADGKYLGSLSDDQLARLLDEMKTKNVSWAIGGLPVEFRKDEATFNAGMKDLPGFAKALRRAGVDKVTTWILPFDKNLTYIANFQTHARRLRAAAEVLGDQNVRFGLEYVAPRTLLVMEKYPFVHTMAEMRDLIAEIGQRNVGLVLDSWHWHCAGDTGKEILALKASDVISVDLNDAPKGVPVGELQDGKRELPAATGVIDVKTFLGSLKQIGYTGPVRAEPFNEAVRRMAPEDAVRATMAAIEKAFSEIG